MTISQLTPNLLVTDIPTSVHFYQDLLGFQILFLVEAGNTTNFDDTLDPTKTYQYAGLRSGNFRISFQTKQTLLQDVPELSNNPISSSFSGTLYLEIDSLADITFKLTATPHRRVPTTWYGMQEIYLSDPDGYILCLGAKDPEFRP